MHFFFVNFKVPKIIFLAHSFDFHIFFRAFGYCNAKFSLKRMLPILSLCLFYIMGLEGCKSCLEITICFKGERFYSFFSL